MDDKRMDGFIMPDGTFVDLDDSDAMLEIARANFATPREIAENMIALAMERHRKGRQAAAGRYFQKALELSDTSGVKAFCLLSLGQLKEQEEDYPGAIQWYRKAFDMETGKDGTWYLLSNNLGYCLNRLGRHAEAAEFCRRAIEMDPGRHNAHKNLGIALEGLGRFADAAASYTRASELCPDDRRALMLFQALARSHPEVAGPSAWN